MLFPGASQSFAAYWHGHFTLTRAAIQHVQYNPSRAMYAPVHS
jgi:hypothetical protein